ncbi:MAG TPA: dienelactone hydrolase family protein, partial [Pseudorhodoplanes sp.]|nr:dienelactone hydrolase family protein [Pseudorhodoplanes sp.]
MKHLGILLVSSLVWSSPSLAEIKEKVVVAANGQKIPVVYIFPDKIDGKIPAMLVMHGSGGPGKREHDYAERFAKIGVASIVIDSFSPRGVKDVIVNQESVRSSEMTLDAIAVLQEAAKHPKLDSSRIGIIGFSKGGAVALRTPFDFVNKAGNAQFALHIAMYPNCDSFRLKFATTGKPIKVLVGEKDTYVNPRACIDLVAQYKNDGADIEVTMLPSAEHGWDVVGSRHWTRFGQNYSKCRFVEISPR